MKLSSFLQLPIPSLIARQTRIGKVALKLLFGFTLFTIGLIIILAVLSRSNQVPHFSSPQKASLSITTTFYPLAEFVHQVGRDNVEVITLTPTGVEPHDFEPTPQDLVRIQQSDLFVYNGAGFEPWVENVLPDLSASTTVIVNSSQDLPLLSGDPHIWLDPILAQHQVTAVKNALIKVDPANAASYETNAAAFSAQLSQLDTDFRQGLATCQRRDIVTSHNAFAYLAKRYDLNVIPITGLTPDAEPSPQRLAEIASHAKAQGVTHIFFETLVTPRLAETIAEEIGAQTLVFNPLEGLTPEEKAAGQNYLYIQRQNLANLKQALNCP